MNALLTGLLALLSVLPLAGEVAMVRIDGGTPSVAYSDTSPVFAGTSR